ncbi:hypothetical protein CsSME_00043036 [Camellia sinensis var. sinensis]
MGTRAKTVATRASGSQPSMDTRAKAVAARVSNSQPSMGTGVKATAVIASRSQPNIGKMAKVAPVRASGSQPLMGSRAKARPSIEPSMPTMARPTPPPGFNCISITQTSTSAPTNSFMFRGRRFVTLSPQKQPTSIATNNKNAN